ITLEILDQSGQLVRRYSSNARPSTPRTPPPFPDYWLPRPETLSAEPGMHRFIWDLRYAPPAAGGGYAMAVANIQTESLPRGPLVVPGSYRIRLRSEEHTSELQSLRHLVCRLLLEKKKKKTHQTAEILSTRSLRV